MRKHQWLAEAVAREGARVLAGATPRADANAVIAAAMTAHPEFVAEMAGALAGKTLGKWLRARETSGDLFQSELFPGLPAAMRVTPKRAAGIASMTGPQLDKARNILWARTQNAMDGARTAAERERAVFDGFYAKVRPLLDEGLTVADVMPALAAAQNTA